MEEVMGERILPELVPGDLFATPPMNPVEQFLTDLLNSETLHWGLVSHSVDDDYEIMEAIPTKGVAVGLLSRMYGDIPIRLYRVQYIPRPSQYEVERIADSYGRAFYAVTSVPDIAAWWLKSHFFRFLGGLPPALDLDSVICTGFVTMVWRDIGVDLVKKYAYPTPEMLEKSESLECIYREF